MSAHWQECIAPMTNIKKRLHINLSAAVNCSVLLVGDVSGHFEVGVVVLSLLRLHTRPHHPKPIHVQEKNGEECKQSSRVT